jgi:hypothetical protein
MAFDFNEARATIEEAKKRGLIRDQGSPDPVSRETPSKPKATEGTSGETLPDWLQKGIQ